MALSASDIVYVLSGGSGNTDPNQALGGEPSAAPLVSGLNNLFPDLDPDQSLAGYVDYRCFYVFNNSGDTTFKNVRAFVTFESPGGSAIAIGLPVVDEKQTVTVSGAPVSGGFTLAYESSQFTVVFNADLATWASNFQNAIRTIPFFDDVEVTAQAFTSATVFTITFKGDAGKRSHPMLTLVANNLSEGSIAFAKVQPGSPINLIPPETGGPTTPPNNVEFTYPTQAQPVTLGDLRAMEGFPVWVQRSTLPGASPKSLDSFKFRVTGVALD